MIFRARPLLAAIPLLLAAWQAAAQAEGGESVVLQADEVRHDTVEGVIVASGSVAVAYKGRTLHADTVTHDEAADTVVASGNVVLFEPTGEEIHADYAELTGDLREGLIRELRIVLADNARLAAPEARRRDGRITELENAAYSPCEICPDNPDEAPLWQVRAGQVIHDAEAQDIVYRNATLEVLGVPVLYTPYLSHPDPQVERRSGFLSPSYGSNPTLGHHIGAPYHFVLAPNRDATLTPILTEKEGVVLRGEYRERMETGRLLFDGSITRTAARDNRGARTGGKKERWHVQGSGLWREGAAWQYGFDVYRASDDNYLSSYDFDHADTLTTSVFARHFDGRSFGHVSAHLFQGLREADDPGQIPVVAPLMGYRLETGPDVSGSIFALDVSAVSLTRSDGVDSRRFSLLAEWERGAVSGGGHVFDAGASLRGDIYSIDDFARRPGLAPDSDSTGRIVPRAWLTWRWPLERMAGSMQQAVEPIVQTVWSPNDSNRDAIPNEDSLGFEFDDVNLFSLDRFAGHDRVEGGLRVNYGLRMNLLDADNRQSELLLGQSWRAQDDDTFTPQSGLYGHSSDYVGRLLIRPMEYLDLVYRFRADPENYSFRRAEFGLDAGPEEARLSLDYIRLDGATADVVDTATVREQFTARGRLELAKEWTLRARWRQDLSGAGAIVYGAGLTYEDECIVFTGSAERRFTDDYGANPATVFLFAVQLKTLG